MRNKIDKQDIEFNLIKAEIASLPFELRTIDVEKTITDLFGFINSKNDLYPQSAILVSLNLLRKNLYNQLIANMVANLGEPEAENYSYGNIISNFWQTPKDIFSADFATISKNELLSLLNEAPKILSSYKTGEIPTKFIKFMADLIPAYGLAKKALEINSNAKIMEESNKIYATYLEDIAKLLQQAKENCKSYHGKNPEIKTLALDLEKLEDRRDAEKGVIDTLDEFQLTDINQAIMNLEPILNTLKIKSKNLEKLLAEEPEAIRAPEKKRAKKTTKKSKDAGVSSLEKTELNTIRFALDLIEAEINQSHKKLSDNRQIIDAFERLRDLISQEKMTKSTFSSIKKLYANLYINLLQTMIGHLGGTVEEDYLITSLSDGFSKQFFTSQPLEGLSKRKLTAKLNETLRTLKNGEEITAGFLQKIISAYGIQIHIKEPVAKESVETESVATISSNSVQTIPLTKITTTKKSLKSKKETVITFNEKKEDKKVAGESTSTSDTKEADQLKADFALIVKNIKSTIRKLPLINPLLVTDSLLLLNKEIGQLITQVNQPSNSVGSQKTLMLLEGFHEQLNSKIAKLSEILSKNQEERQNLIFNSIASLERKASGIRTMLKDFNFDYTSEELAQLNNEITNKVENAKIEISNSSLRQISTKQLKASNSLDLVLEKIKTKTNEKNVAIIQAQFAVDEKVFEISKVLKSLMNNLAYANVVDVNAMSKELSDKEQTAKKKLAQCSLLEIATTKSATIVELNVELEKIKTSIRAKNKTFITEIAILRQRLSDLNEKKSVALKHVDSFVIDDRFEEEIARLERIISKSDNSEDLYDLDSTKLYALDLNLLDELNTAMEQVEQDKIFYEEALWIRANSDEISIINTLLSQINRAAEARLREIQGKGIHIDADPAYSILNQLQRSLVVKKEGYLNLDQCSEKPLMLIQDFLTQMNNTLTTTTLKQLSESTSNVFVNLVNDLIAWISSFIDSVEVRPPYQVQFFPSPFEQRVANAANNAHKALNELKEKWEDIESATAEDTPESEKEIIADSPFTI